MKLNTGVGMLAKRNVEKTLSKKILLANTSDRKSKDKLGVGNPSDPIYFSNSSRQTVYNPDIRYRNNYGYSPITDINARNALLVFSENNEIKKAIKAICNEIIVSNLKSYKYPVNPIINLSTIPEDKQDVAKAIQTYLDEIFFPDLYRMLKLKNKGLFKLISEFLKTGKIAYEIVYDNLKRPKEIVNMIPIDPSELQKFMENDNIYYVQRSMSGDTKERIMHENQVVILEWNEWDFGYISYVDQLRRPFNIMRGMQSSKILWFAVKSQVRMHIKLNMGDVSRQDAIQKLAVARDEFTNDFFLDEASGQILFNGEADSTGYHEFFTAETSQSGTPEIEEIIGNGPDLTEVDSLQYWEKLFWKETEIPFDRIDPSSSETWNFVDVTNVRKSEINFSKFILDIKTTIAEIFIKPIIIQLTLKEAEIGVDMALLDSILLEFVSFNEYDKLGELEVLDKKIQIATNIAAFGELEDAEGRARKYIPLQFIVDNYLDFTPEQKVAMDLARKRQDVDLGFIDEDGNFLSTEEEEEEPTEETEEDFNSEDIDFTDDDEENISDTDDAGYE